MMDYLIELDKNIFFHINGLHQPWMDTFMFYVSEKVIWTPLYVMLLYVVLKHFRNDSWAPLIGIAITILLADQLASTLLKPLVQRLRPTHDPSIQHLVHIVHGYKGGKFGFASSHAANTFGVSLFFWLMIGKQKKWILFLFVWAFLVCYSRIYLGVHYPGDIIAGIMIGLISGLIGFKIYLWLGTLGKKNRALPGSSSQ